MFIGADRTSNGYLAKYALPTGFDGKLALVVACAGVATAYLCSLLLEDILQDRLRLVFFFPALLLAAAGGGMLPGLLAFLLSLLAATVLYGLGDKLSIDTVNLATFAVAALAVTVMGALLHDAWRAIDRIRQSLTSREAYIQLLFDTVPDAAVVFDEGGAVVSLNVAAVRLFGHEESDVIGKNVRVLMPPLYNGEHPGYLNHCLGTSEKRLTGLDRILTGRRKDGSAFPMRLVVGETNAVGKRYFTAFVQDLTERQKSAARLNEVQGELARLTRVNEQGEMASILAHELNQPLSAIANYAQGCARMLEGAVGDNPQKLRQVFGEITQHSLRAGEIISHLRQFVLRGESERTPQNIRRLVDESAAIALAGLRVEEVKTIFHFGTNAENVMVDRVQIQQVLTNLIRNAAEAMRESETRDLLVDVSLTTDGDVLVEVSDTGPGVAQDIESRLFVPFVTTKADGMGIGLSISKRIVEAHGGAIRAYRNKRGGATFCFSLPAFRGSTVNA